MAGLPLKKDFETEKEDENDQFTDLVIKKKNSLKKLEEKLKLVKKEKSDLQKRYSFAEHENKRIQSEFDKLQKKSEILTEKNKELKEDVSNKIEYIKKCDPSILKKGFEKEKRRLFGLIRSLKRDNSRIVDEKKALKLRLVNKNLNNLEKAIQDKKSNINKLKKKQKAQIRGKQQELEKLKKNLKTYKNKLKKMNI
jgi:chromosome segregation ATPase